jgi:serine/threonine-protein kinase HipA
VSANTQRHLRVGLGTRDDLVGRLMFSHSDMREHSTFQYDEAWLQREDAFGLSPDLPPAVEPHHAGSTVFHLAVAETLPTGWGGRVLRAQRAMERRTLTARPTNSSFTALDDLLAVQDDFRIGALRLSDARLSTQNHSPEPRKTNLSTVLSSQLRACHALEKREMSDEHMPALAGYGTALGGVRPKTTFFDDGCLVIAKFPSPGDETELPRAEILALQLAAAAGIVVPKNRIVVVDGQPVALIERFDRTAGGDRTPFLSSAAMLQVDSAEDHTYTEVCDAIRTYSAAPQEDLEELWRRVVFSMLITNNDDHLRNHGFLHAGRGLWRLSPAFDINPSPGSQYSAKTWLSEDSGPAATITDALNAAAFFGLQRDRALQILAKVHAATKTWRQVAASPLVGMKARDLRDFAPAFEHAQAECAWRLVP